MTKLFTCILLLCLIYSCNSQPNETPQEKLQKQLWEQEQARRFEQQEKERQRIAETQEILNKLPAYQEMKRKEEEEKARLEAQRAQSSSSDYDDLESRVEELEAENRRLKSNN